MTIRHLMDLAGKEFLVGSESEPVKDFETKLDKVDENGEVIHTTSLVVMEAGGADVIQVKTAGKPQGLVVGSPATLKSLVAFPWSMGQRNGVSYRAESISPKAPTRAASSEVR